MKGYSCKAGSRRLRFHREQQARSAPITFRVTGVPRGASVVVDDESTVASEWLSGVTWDLAGIKMSLFLWSNYRGALIAYEYHDGTSTIGALSPLLCIEEGRAAPTGFCDEVAFFRGPPVAATEWVPMPPSRPPLARRPLSHSPPPTPSP